MKTLSLVCPKCRKTFELEVSDSQLRNGKYRKFCSRACANSRTWTDEINTKRSKSILKFVEEHGCAHLRPYKMRKCKYCGQDFTTATNDGGYKYCSNECRKRWMLENWKPTAGGYRKGSGRGKSGWYRGIYCDSSWELAFVVWHLDHNIQIQRNRTPYSYIFEGETHQYYPDFIVNGELIEIKGYKTKQWEAKLSQLPINIKVLYGKDMKPYLDYMLQTYGKDWLNLYDK